MLRLKNIEAVIWDLDGVIHSYIPFTTSLPHYNLAAVRAFHRVAESQHIYHEIPLCVATEMADASFKKWGLSTAQFTLDYKLDPHSMHMAFHEEIPKDKVLASNPDVIAGIKELSHLKHIILTQGSNPYAVECIEAYGLTSTFKKHAIIGFENVERLKKSQSSKPVLQALETLGVPAARAVMVEDMKKNLKPAFDVNVQTAFIKESGLEDAWIDLPKPEDRFVTQSFDTTLDFIRCLQSVLQPS